MWNRRALTGEQQKLDILPAVGFAVHWNPNNFVSSSLNGGENEFVYGDLVLELPFISLVGWDSAYSLLSEAYGTDSAYSLCKRVIVAPIPRE